MESIKEMDPLTQRSNLLINETDIYPSNEYLLNQKISKILKYLDQFLVHKV